MRTNFLFIAIISFLYSCDSFKQPEPYVPTVCDSYDNEFGKLKDRIKAFYSENIKYYHLGKLLEAERDIERFLNNLDTFKCASKSHRAFTRNLLDSITILKAKEVKNNEEEEKNGEDMMMYGVKISSHKIVYDENAQPSIVMELENNTKVAIKSIVFQISYCDKRIKHGMFEQDDPDCYESVLVKGPIAPFSKGTCGSPIDASKFVSSGQTDVVIYKIIREDGTMVKRLNYKGPGND